jgi:hypothetical protein
MHKRKALGLFTVVAAFAMTGLGTGSALATGTIESLATGACQWGGGGSPVFDWRGIYNSGTSTMTVECGIPSNRDLQSATNWSVHIDDQSTANASCRFRMMDTDGSTIATSGSKNTSGTGSKPLFWDWNEVTRTDPSSFGAVSGITYVSCSIPAVQNGKRSGLNGVYVQKQF